MFFSVLSTEAVTQPRETGVRCYVAICMKSKHVFVIVTTAKNIKWICFPWTVRVDDIVVLNTPFVFPPRRDTSHEPKLLPR